MAVLTTVQKTALFAAGTVALLQAGCAGEQASNISPSAVTESSPGTVRSEADSQTFQLTQGSILKTPLSTIIVRPAIGNKDVLRVPGVALQKVGSKRVVYVVLPDDSFRETVVETGKETNDYVEIRRGLKVGDRIVTNGAFSLRSHMIKWQNSKKS